MAIIPDENARTFINHYRSTLPDYEIKSLWMDRDIIENIQRLDINPDNDRGRLSGLRLYFARYKENVPPTGNELYPRNRLTVIAVPTVNAGNDLEVDIPGFYMDAALPCPPTKCNGSI